MNTSYSRGCVSCQHGRWVCIFLTYLCGAKCSFCPAPLRQEDKIVSAFGNTLEGVLEGINNGPFDAVSFSGGDPFAVYGRFVEWLAYFKKRRKDIYYWAYTSGLNAAKQQFEELARIGLNELRFNIAATGYDSPVILERIASAAKVIENVAVEIPSIPADYGRLIRILPCLAGSGVKYLNLHEYILMPNDPGYKKAKSSVFTLNKVDKLTYDTASHENTEKIKRFCLENGLNIAVNDCSMRKKDNQMLYRRLVMGEVFRKKHECLTKDGLLEAYIACPLKMGMNEIREFVNNNNIDKYMIRREDFSKRRAGAAAKLTFLPPLSVDSKRILLCVEPNYE